jgi:hypothetical protein
MARDTRENRMVGLGAVMQAAWTGSTACRSQRAEKGVVE